MSGIRYEVCRGADHLAAAWDPIYNLFEIRLGPDVTLRLSPEMKTELVAALAKADLAAQHPICTECKGYCTISLPNDRGAWCAGCDGAGLAKLADHCDDHPAGGDRCAECDTMRDLRNAWESMREGGPTGPSYLLGAR